MTNIEAIKAAGTSEIVTNEIKAFRSAAVTSENRATPLARSLLAALLAETSTKAFIVTAVLLAFGNPKSLKGKVLDKLSGSGDYLPGFGATRKTVDAIFTVYDNMNATGARDAIVAFILQSEGAAKSLRALRETVMAAVKADAEAASGDNSEAEADAKAAEAEAKGETPAAPVSLNDRVNALIVAYGAADAEAKAEAHDALQALFALVNADVMAEAGEAEASEPAAPVLVPAE